MCGIAQGVRLGLRGTRAARPEAARVDRPVFCRQAVAAHDHNSDGQRAAGDWVGIAGTHDVLEGARSQRLGVRHRLQILDKQRRRQRGRLSSTPPFRLRHRRNAVRRRRGSRKRARA